MSRNKDSMMAIVKKVKKIFLLSQLYDDISHKLSPPDDNYSTVAKDLIIEGSV